MNFLLTPLIKLGILAAVLGGIAFSFWYHGHRQYQRGLHEMAALVDAKGQEVDLIRGELAKVKSGLVVAAEATFVAEKQTLEKRNVELKVIADSRLSALNRLRATSVDPNKVSGATEGTCRVDDLRTANRLLAEGQAIAIEGAGLLDEALGLVGQGETALGEQAAVIRLAQSYAKAVAIPE
jgi:hypothetical protein